MDLITLLTITNTVALWANIIVTVILFFTIIYFIDFTSKRLYRIGLDLVQLLHAYNNYRLDITERKTKFEIECEQAKILIRAKRVEILSKFD